MFRPPYDLPGTSIQNPHKLGNKKCPHCHRIYQKELIKVIEGKIQYLCPYCKKVID